MGSGDDSGRQMLPLSPVIKKEALESPFSPGNGSPGEGAFSSPAMSPTMSSTTTNANASATANGGSGALASDTHMDFATTPTSTEASMTFHASQGTTPVTATSSSPKTDFLCNFTSPLDGGGSGGGGLPGGGPPSTPTTPTTPVTPVAMSVGGSHQQHHPGGISAPPSHHHHQHHHHHHHQRRKSGYDSSASPDSPDRHFCSSTTQSSGDLNLSSRTEVGFNGMQWTFVHVKPFGMLYI